CVVFLLVCSFFLMIRPHPTSTLFPYTTLFRSYPSKPVRIIVPFPPGGTADLLTRLTAEKLTARFAQQMVVENRAGAGGNLAAERSEEHTSELQSPYDLVCRLLLEKKKSKQYTQ